MKNVLLCLALILATKSFFAQNRNFPDSNAIWSVYDQKYFVKGDSVYNSLKYKKYYFTNDSIVVTGSFFALLREDTIAKKVFAIKSGSTQERLLYDFSLNVNQTATVYPISFPVYSGPIRVKVISKDSILLGGNYHKRLKVEGMDENTNYDEYWMQGIGSTMGLFNSGITGKVVFDVYYPMLLCFQKNGTILYTNPGFTGCYKTYPTGVDEFSFVNNWNIFPNPFSSALNIQSEGGISRITLSNTLGMELNAYYPEQNDVTLNTGELPAGIYFVTIETKKGKFIKKVVKD